MRRMMHDLTTRPSCNPARNIRVQLLQAPFGRWLITCGLVALMGILEPSAVSQPVVTALLGALHLTSYPQGTKPPEFDARTTEGETVTLAQLRGRVVLLNFWATWCQECRPEMPVFERLHRDFAAEGLTILGVNLREGVQAVQQYAERLNLTFPLLLDPSGKSTASYGVIGLPTTFLIGRDGRAVALAIGAREWASAPARAIIQALLVEAAE
jgi:peroxiredoxin